ncbi:MAG TPA: hypothetical protein VFC44_13410 [Candidatus Saccharimonadales bacterium]|nr:hypothetical protein [Candidatus Saccharimonadales bacterium]
MSKINNLLFLLLLAALVAGCSTITNLTPSQYPRDPSGFYRVEAEWRSREQAIRPDSFQPVVLVDFNAYPMHPIPLVEDRWEAFIPIPANKDYILYRYKFDFMENAISKPCGNSVMSAGYELRIEPKK